MSDNTKQQRGPLILCCIRAQQTPAQITLSHLN